MGQHPTIQSNRWVNETRSLADRRIPQASFSSLAYDFHDNYYLFFGGCTASRCPSNDTWTYSDGLWRNVTTAIGASPPARTSGAMDYDPTMGAVLLFGGCGLICPLNDTWVYATGVWTNISSSMCSSACPIAAYGSSLVWDANDGVSVLFGGCTSVSCLTSTNQTLENLGGAWFLPPISTFPPSRGFASMAYDPVINRTVLFGGEYSCGLFAYCGLNDTWWYSISNRWQNATAPSLGVPPTRAFAMMSWDNVTSELLLVGGYNLSTTSAVGDTWAYICPLFCSWSNVTSTSGPGARYAGAMAENNSGFAPILVGGSGPGAPQIADMWAYGNGPFSTSATINPNPTTYNFTTSFNGSASGGAAPYRYTWSFPMESRIYLGTSTSSNFTFPQPRSEFVREVAIDSSGMLAAHDTSFLVLPKPAVTITANPLATDAGFSIGLTAAIQASTGLPPFATTWTFGDLTTSSGPSVTHVFAAAGTYLVTANMSDRAGHYGTSQTSIVVQALPTVTSSASIGTTDVGMGVNFSATGALGTLPYSYNWSFGDHSFSNASTVSGHTFGSPGVYHVLLSLVDAVGARTNHTVNITVNGLPSVAFTISDTTPKTGQVVQFNGTAAGGTGSLSYIWVFGDGQESTGATSSHNYSSTGTYTVTLTVRDQLNGLGSMTKQVTVSAPDTGTKGKTPNGGTPFSLTAGLSLLVVLLIVVVLALVVLAMRRRGPPPPPPQAWTAPGAAAPAGTAAAEPAWYEGPPPGAVGSPPEK